MRIDVIKKLSKISLLALISGGLVACNNDKEEKETDLFTLVSSLKENSNYTLHIEDDLGSLNQWFMPKFYAYNFGDSSKDIYTAYIEDDIGIYNIKINSKTNELVTYGYYEQDSTTGEYVHGLYENVTYSLADLALSAKDYSLTDDKLYIANLNSDDAKVMYSIFGYVLSGSNNGYEFSNVNDMYFSLNSEKKLEFCINFKKSAGLRQASIMTFNDINNTKIPTEFDFFFKDHDKGKIRVNKTDTVFSYLQSLKNMRNYTVKITTNYKVKESGYDGNFVAISKFTPNAYYGTKSNDTTGDFGLIVEKTGDPVKEFLYEEDTGKVIIGDVYKTDAGNTKYDVFDCVNSFADLYWNINTIGASKIDDYTYSIDDADIITTLAYISTDTFFRFEWEEVKLTFDKDKLTYKFECFLIDDESLTIEVYDVNKTSIGSIK